MRRSWNHRAASVVWRVPRTAMRSASRGEFREFDGHRETGGCAMRASNADSSSHRLLVRHGARAVLAALLLLTLGSTAVLAKPGHEARPSSIFLARPDGPGGRLIGYDTVTGEERFS